LQVRRKADATLVTDADLAAEAILVEGLRRLWPADAIVSEECGQVGQPGSGATWLVDPIDGTSAFTEDLAHWGPTIARVVQGRVALGATWLPRLRELYLVESRAGVCRAWFGAEPLPAPASDPPRVVYLPSRFHAHFGLRWRGKGRCLGGTAAHLALVARGAAAAAIVAPGWARWDTAVGLALIEAVGGAAALLEGGGPLDAVAHAGLAFVAGTPAAVAALQEPGALLPLPTETSR
jgi:myo-inositol-1(or 4)-monophosphatase